MKNFVGALIVLLLISVSSADGQWYIQEYEDSMAVWESDSSNHLVGMPIHTVRVLPCGILILRVTGGWIYQLDGGVVFVPEKRRRM